MGEHITQDPELVDEFKADASGRVTLGTEYSNCVVRVVVEESRDGQNNRKIGDYKQ